MSNSRIADLATFSQFIVTSSQLLKHLLMWCSHPMFKLKSEGTFPLKWINLNLLLSQHKKYIIMVNNSLSFYSIVSSFLLNRKRLSVQFQPSPKDMKIKFICTQQNFDVIHVSSFFLSFFHYTLLFFLSHWAFVPFSPPLL